MPVSINNTTLTFNDATTQTTSGVTSIGTGTGISSTGGKTPTLTNTGVTSVTAGSGISVSASTGGVTISTSGGGGVTSLNGQTGAITNTNLDAIGSTVGAVHAATAPRGNTITLNTNDTVAGSALRYNYGLFTNWPIYIGTNATPSFGLTSTSSGGNGSVGYASGGSSLSGTWRLMSRCVGNTNGGDDCNISQARWFPGMFVRIS